METIKMKLAVGYQLPEEGEEPIAEVVKDFVNPC